MKYCAVVLSNGYIESIYDSKKAAVKWANTLNTQSRDSECVYRSAEVVCGLNKIRRASGYLFSVEEIRRKYQFGL